MVPPGFALKIRISLSKKQHGTQKKEQQNVDEEKEDINFVVRDQRERGITTIVKPEILVSQCLIIFTLALVTTFAFHQSSSYDYRNGNPLTKGFQQKPWAYIFAPLWFLLNGIIMMSTKLMSYRTKMLLSSEQHRTMGGAGVGLCDTSLYNTCWGWRNVVTQIIWLTMCFLGTALLWLVIPNYDLNLVLVLWGISFLCCLSINIINIGWKYSTKYQIRILLTHLFVTLLGLGMCILFYFFYFLLFFIFFFFLRQFMQHQLIF